MSIMFEARWAFVRRGKREVKSQTDSVRRREYASEKVHVRQDVERNVRSQAQLGCLE